MRKRRLPAVSAHGFTYASRKSSSADGRQRSSRMGPNQTRWRSRWWQFFSKVMTVVVALLVVLGGGAWWAWQRLGIERATVAVFFLKQPDQAASQVATTDQVIVAVAQPALHRVRLWRLPADTKVPVIGGYGEYPVAAVPGLLAIDKKSSAQLRATVSHALGVGVDEVRVSVTTQSVENAGQLTKVLGEQVGQWPKAYQPEWRRAARWYAWLNRLPDSPQAITAVANPAELGEVLQKEMPTSGFEADRCPVAVVNTTGTAGLATKLSQILESSHVLVVRVTDTTQPSDQTKVLVSAAAPEDPDCQAVLNKVATVLPFEMIPVTDESAVKQYRAKVVLWLGKGSEKSLR